MKIIVPEFVLPAIQQETCELVQACDFVDIDAQGRLRGDATGAEVVMIPWQLPPETQAALFAQPTVRWFHSASAGVDQALGDALRAHPAVLTNGRGVFDAPVAETVLAYILMAVKRMPEFLRQQQARQWHRLALREVAGLTVGLVGMGHIGSEIAQRCHALGMRVIATRRNPDRGDPHVERMLPSEQLGELLATSDFVVLAVPLTAETEGLIGAEQLRRMRSDAWLINIARGSVVQTDALLTALREGWIAGAALDVFDPEPLPEESPLWGLENVILTPHNTWSTPHFHAREAALFIENLRRFLRDEPLRNVVDKEQGY